MSKWGEKIHHLYFLTKFGDLKRKVDEFVFELTKIFNKVYNQISPNIKPSRQVSKVTLVALLIMTGLMLRERISTTFTGMQDGAIEIKENMETSRKIRVGEDLE